jgi:tetratricopeptide (TPR) repeat protein
MMLGRIGNRLQLLTGGPRDLPPRQQTLRNAIEWSYNLLDSEEQTLFTRLAAFVGGCTLDAVKAIVTDDEPARSAQGKLTTDDLPGAVHPSHTQGLSSVVSTQDALESLITKSLLRREVGVDEEPRFGMLETIYEFARERLKESGEAEKLRGKHAAYYLALAEEAEPQLSGPDQARWLARLEEEHDNFREALRWTMDATAPVGHRPSSIVKTETTLRMAGALWRFWLVHGYYSEGRQHLNQALEVSNVPAFQLSNTWVAKALNGAAVMAWRQNDFEGATALSNRALSIYKELGDKVGMAQSLHNLGNVAHRHSDYEAASGYFSESLAARREVGDQRGTADSLNNLAMVMDEQGDYSHARGLYEESLAIYRELGDKRGIANSLVNLGFVAWEQRDNEGARALYEESLPIYRELGDKRGIANALNNLGLVAWEQNDLDEALALFKESLVRHRDLEDRQGLAECLEGLARVAGSQGKAFRAARLWGSAQALRDAIGIGIAPGDLPEYEQNMAVARNALDAVSWKVAWAQGYQSTVEQAAEYGLDSSP